MAIHQSHQSNTVSCYLTVVPSCYHAFLQRLGGDTLLLVIVASTHLTNLVQVRWIHLTQNGPLSWAEVRCAVSFPDPPYFARVSCQYFFFFCPFASQAPSFPLSFLKTLANRKTATHSLFESKLSVLVQLAKLCCFLKILLLPMCTH